MTTTTLETDTAFTTLGFQARLVVRRLSTHGRRPTKEPEVTETSGKVRGEDERTDPPRTRRMSGVGDFAHDRLTAPQFSHPATKSPSADRRGLISALHCEQAIISRTQSFGSFCRTSTGQHGRAQFPRIDTRGRDK